MVLYALLYVVVRLMLEALIVRGRSEARLRAEVLALAAISRVLAQAGLAIAHAQAGDAAPLASGAVPA